MSPHRQLPDGISNAERRLFLHVSSKSSCFMVNSEGFVCCLSARVPHEAARHLVLALQWVALFLLLHDSTMDAAQ